MKSTRGSNNKGTRRGAATLAAVFTLMVVIGLSGVILMVNHRESGQRRAMVNQEKARAGAQSAIGHVMANLAAGDDDDVGAGKPVDFAGGTYWADLTDNEDGTYTVLASSTVRNSTETIEVVVQGGAESVFERALFAGNSDEDPLYELEIGGTGAQADEVTGGAYSGGDFTLTGDATIGGSVDAAGIVTGTPGQSHTKAGTPDLDAMNYESAADYDVSSLFGTAAYTSDDAGGTAWQLPESNPAHIFRKNPSDRATETSGTVKDDYFLEDPYENVRVDPNENGKDAYGFSLTGIAGEPGPDSNGTVFYIDGNLWVHNKKSYSLGLKHTTAGGVQATFVVKGNIYFSDNLFYRNKEKDGIAFIAMEDEKVTDSGNIYFGDPVFGTLKEMNAFMYAENNFYDMNLDASGSAEVAVHGNMTAGNQVLVQRDYVGWQKKYTGKSKYTWVEVKSHTKLTIDFDDRISSGDLEMPGLPKSTTGDGEAYSVLSWRKVANQ